MSAQPQPETVRRLPLWKAWLDDMRELGKLEFGGFFAHHEIASHLSCPVDSLEYAFAMVEIRKALRREGKNLTGRGTGGEGFLITPPEMNAKAMTDLQSKAIRSLREGVILGTTTPLELLDAEAKRKHLAVLEKLATRLALVSSRKPKILKDTAKS